MTAIKLDSKLPANAVPDELAKTMWDTLGSHHMAIVELKVSERTEPAEGEADSSAKLRVAGIEFATDDADDERLRQGMRDRYAARTAAGTLDEDHTWYHERPDVGFHQALADLIEDRGQLGGYTATAEISLDGTLTVTVGERAEGE